MITVVLIGLYGCDSRGKTGIGSGFSYSLDAGGFTFYPQYDGQADLDGGQYKEPVKRPRAGKHRLSPDKGQSAGLYRMMRTGTFWLSERGVTSWQA